MILFVTTLLCRCRQNQELEQDSYEAHEEAVRLQKEASALQERLQAVLHDKFHHQRHSFDAETPIDKALNFLSNFIAVCHLCVVFVVVHAVHTAPWCSINP